MHETVLERLERQYQECEPDGIHICSATIAAWEAFPALLAVCKAAIQCGEERTSGLYFGELALADALAPLLEEVK